MRVNDLGFGILMLLLGSITVWASWDFPALPRQQYGAGTFPTVVGSALVVLGGVLAARGWQRRGALLAWRSEIPIGRTLLCIAIVVAAILGYVLLAPILGFPIVSMVLLTAMIGWLSNRWLLAVITALIATALIWMVFARVLLVPLSLGILEGVIYR